MISAFYINGIWRAPAESGEIAGVNPATAEVLHRVAAGGAGDVNKAVRAARADLPG